MPPYLSIVIPAYNEERRIGASLKQIVHYLMQQEYSAEIIVVDDGSRDATRDVVVRETQSLPNNVQLQLISCHPNRGKGAAVKDGCLAACGRYVLFTDADLATPITEWDKLRAPLDAGCDLAIGSRVHPGGSDMRTTQPRYRRLLGRGYHLLVVLLAVRGIPDTQCGFKAMTRETAQELFPLQRLTGIVFDTELLYLAQRRGMDIAQVPVEWYNVGGSRMRVTIRQALRVLFDLLSIRLLHWRDPADKKSSQAEEVTQR